MVNISDPPEAVLLFFHTYCAFVCKEWSETQKLDFFLMELNLKCISGAHLIVVKRDLVHETRPELVQN